MAYQSVQILSSNEASVVLAPICYLILLGRAVPAFPGTTRSHPSPTVRFASTGNGELSRLFRGPNRVGVSGYEEALNVVPVEQSLRLSVVGTQWRTCVVPVLKSETFSAENLVTWSLSADQILTLLTQAIGSSFEAAGYGPFGG